MYLFSELRHFSLNGEPQLNVIISTHFEFFPSNIASFNQTIHSSIFVPATSQTNGAIFISNTCFHCLKIFPDKDQGNHAAINLIQNHPPPGQPPRTRLKGGKSPPPEQSWCTIPQDKIGSQKPHPRDINLEKDL